MQSSLNFYHYEPHSREFIPFSEGEAHVLISRQSHSNKKRLSKNLLENIAETGRKCTWCPTTITPEWRKGPNGILLCNACGLHFQRKLKNDQEKPKQVAISKQENVWQKRMQNERELEAKTIQAEQQAEILAWQKRVGQQLEEKLESQSARPETEETKTVQERMALSTILS